MSESLEFLWSCLDTPEPLFLHRAVASWPAAVREWLISSDVLRETTAASQVTCPICEDGHTGEVITVHEPPPVRYYLPCPESMRVVIDPEDLRRWTLNCDALAVLLAKALNLSGKPKAVSAARLWRLGTTSWHGHSRELLFARGLNRDDAAVVAAHIGREGRPIVLVPCSEPPADIWKGRPPACIALARVMTFNGPAVIVDVLLLHDLIQQADQLREQLQIMPLDPNAKKLTVRRQVKAEIKGHLEDDVLIAARFEHGSVRKAAEALTNKLGRPVTKDQVQRAIDRAGGLKALLEREDSASIQRTVASQSRDRQKNFAQRR